jgi:hypothetical protein
MEGIVMLPYLAIAALAEQRQADRRHQAKQARLALSHRLARRPHRGLAARRWRLLAQRPADA